MTKLNPLLASALVLASFTASPAEAALNFYGALSLYKGRVVDVTEVGDGQCAYTADVLALDRENSIECLFIAEDGSLEETALEIGGGAVDTEWRRYRTTVDFIAPCVGLDIETVHAEGVPFFGYDVTAPAAAFKRIDKASPLLVFDANGEPVENEFGTFAAKRRGVMLDTAGSAEAMTWRSVRRTLLSTVLSGGSTMWTGAVATAFGDNLDVFEQPMHLVTTNMQTENRMYSASADETAVVVVDADSGMEESGYYDGSGTAITTSSTASEFIMESPWTSDYYLNDRTSR